MAKNDLYEYIIVESYTPDSTSGLHGEIHIRPAKGQKYDQSLHVRCSKKLSKDYPVGTKFRIQAKLTDREGSGEFLHSDYRWPYDVIE